MMVLAMMLLATAWCGSAASVVVIVRIVVLAKDAAGSCFGD